MGDLGDEDGVMLLMMMRIVQNLYSEFHQRRLEASKQRFLFRIGGRSWNERVIRHPATTTSLMAKQLLLRHEGVEGFTTPNESEAVEGFKQNKRELFFISRTVHHHGVLYYCL